MVGRGLVSLQAIKEKLRIWNKEVFVIIEVTKNKLAHELEILERMEETQNLNAEE